MYPQIVVLLHEILVATIAHCIVVMVFESRRRL